MESNLKLFNKIKQKPHYSTNYNLIKSLFNNNNNYQPETRKGLFSTGIKPIDVNEKAME